ncbi:MAG: hypothetical protein ABSF18_04430, partial [Gammaproteobacteria bacterium]
NSVTEIYLNKLIDFVEYEQLVTITSELPINVLDKINAAIKYRLIYFLMEHVYAVLCQFRGGINIITSKSYDQNLLKKIDRVTIEAAQNQDKRSHIHLLFYSELQIREASILATGEILTPDHISDIFLVYKTAAFGASQRKQDGTISYYNLAVKTLTQLSKAANVMQSHHQQLIVSISPINQETAVGHHGLVRRTVFGVSISYQDNQALDITSSPGFNHVYQVTPHYKLETDLKLAMLEHIKNLAKQLSDSPNHPHKKRRQEKLAALEYIVHADNQQSLSPSTIEEARAGKNLIYVATGESTTQQLIEYAQSNIKAKMWQQFSRDIA